MSQPSTSMDYDKQIICQCRLCSGYSIVLVRSADFDNWRERGVYAQHAFPYLSNGDRELLISRTCDDCWQEMFGSPDDDDEDEE